MPARANLRVNPRAAKTARTGKSRLTGAERRERFLDVAADLIVVSGIESVTMERVAERSGVSKALGYGYFENSDRLLAAVFEREVAGLDRRVLARIVGVNDAEERMRAIMDETFEVVSARGPLLGRLLQHRGHGGALEAARRKRQQFVEKFFAQMMEQDVGVPARQAAVASAIWQAAVTGVLELALARSAPRREIVEVFARMVVGGTRALRDKANSNSSNRR
ncbi:MAG: TetR/AcrR family transcriptional regulator [Nevskiales bacterium]